MTGFTVGGPELGPKALSLRLLAYGASIPDLWRRAARLVDRLLRGARPADIPVEQANVHDLVVNLRTARALGIALPQGVLLRATRVID